MGPTADDQPNPEKTSAFDRRVIDIINDGALALLLSIGHRTGLFDVMAERSPSTVEGLAEAAGLSERCLREWLEAMAKADIVSHDPSFDTYELPPEQAASLSRGASSKNLAALAEYVPLLGAMEDQIVESFQKDGRVPYDARPSFRQMISKAANESDRAVVATLADSILPLVPGLLDSLDSGIDVLDIGCGSGRAVNLLASTFPKSHFCGHDPVTRHIDRALNASFFRGLVNVEFWVKAVADLDEVARYDLITDFDAIRNQPQAGRVLENVARALRPGGNFLMQEVAASKDVDDGFGLPLDSALYTVSSMQRIAQCPAEANAGSGGLRSEETVKSMLLESGFESVIPHRLPHHVYNRYFVATKGGG
jgi:SAM-dependent methyltransferase